MVFVVHAIHEKKVNQPIYGILLYHHRASQLLGADRSKLFNFLVHMADISHPGKPWKQHTEWTDRLCEEFFQQGDEERRLGRKCSPLCDRYDTNVAESQQGGLGAWVCC